MEPRVVQDSDDEASDGGTEAPALQLREQAKGTAGQLMRGLQYAHARMLQEDAAHPDREVQEVQPSPIPTISVQREQSYGNMSLPGLTTSETISSDHTARLDEDDVEGESQKRKADIDLTDEDEVCFVPARKKQRGDRKTLPQPVPSEPWNAASMPPPASQESIASRASATSQKSALKVQPSPPRLQDNMSFTTTNSSATSFQGARGARMFPALDSDSFQQRLNDMDLDPETEPDSMPASQDDPTITAPRPLPTQRENSSSSPEEAAKSDGALKTKTSPSAPSDDQIGYTSGNQLKDGTPHNVPPPGRQSTLVRVEVPLLQTHEIPQSQEDSDSNNTTYRKVRHTRIPTQSSLADGELADGEENATEDTIKLEAKQKQKKPKPKPKSKKAMKKRGRTRKAPSPDAEESGTDEDGVSEERKGSKPASIISKTGPKNEESATTSNATSFVADTPSPELAAGEPVNIPEAMPGTPDRDSDSVRSGKHSPLNNGKVPLRVGLSKRVHIEPLLKGVRK